MKFRFLFFTGGFLLVFLFSSIPAQAQEQVSVRDKADKFFEQLQYSKASEIYLRMTDVPNSRYQDMKRLAICFMKMNKNEDAEIWYSRVVADPNSIPEDLYNYGELLKINANYSDAKGVFQDYLDKTGDERALVNIAGCDSAEVWMSNPTGHIIRNEAGINTDLSEFSVFPFGGTTVCFIGEPSLASAKKTYGWTGSPFLRIFSAQKQENNSLGSRELSKTVYNDASYHVGPISTNMEGSTYYITRTYPGEKGSLIKINGNRYLTQNMELYIQTKKYDQWLKPISFPYNNVQKYSLGQAVLSKDEKVLYYVSDMPGGQGGTDIWFSELKPNGAWGKSRNAGNVINTAGDEMFPNVGPDGTLYFSSNGFPGMGGLDIFSSIGEMDNWNTPVNMRYPINSSCDDFSFILNDDLKSGYLSSNRANGKGGDDIYSFEYKDRKKVYFIEGIVYDKKTRKRLPEANVVLYNANKNILAKQKSNPDGSFLFRLQVSSPSNLKASKDRYYPDTVRVNRNDLPYSKPQKLALYLDPLFETGKSFKLENILYDFDKDNIRKDAALILNGLVTIMYENPTLQIELASHTDSRGNNEYNMNLSQRRAQSAVDYLVSRGISRERMVAKGYGESRLLNKCADGVDCSEEEHQQNRRTMFTILAY